jgi:protein SCO1/2
MWWRRPPELHGTMLQSAPPPADVALIGADGEEVRLSDLSDQNGKWTLLYFGYTYCPDICPTTLSTLNQSIELLGERAENVQVVMVTVDPERDTPERIATYVSYFNPAFIGLSGTLEATNAAATAFGVFYEKVATEGATEYLINHTSTVAVLDPEGRLRYVFPHDATADNIASDLAYLIRRG